MIEYGLFNDDSSNWTAEEAVEAGFYSEEDARAAVADRYSDEDELVIHEIEDDDEEEDDDAMKDIRVRLLTVEGDKEGFADVIGKVGELEFNATQFVGGGEVITLEKQSVSRVGSLLRVETDLGNTFVFRVLKDN